MNHSQPSQFDDHVEPWHLTAFALGELDPDTRDRVQRRMDADPQLAMQLVEIQQTLDVVQRELKRSIPVVGLDDDHTRGVFEHLQNDPASIPVTQVPSANRWNGLRIGSAIGAGFGCFGVVVISIQLRTATQVRTRDQLRAADGEPGPKRGSVAQRHDAVQ